MDIALWQLESILTREIALRPHRHVSERMPRWVERAVREAREGRRPVVVPTTTTRIMTRK
jgi:hypothetical protein